MAGALALHFANRSGVVYGQSFARLQHRETGHLAYEDTPFGGCARWRDLGTVPPNKSGHRLVTLLWSSCVAPGVDVGLVSPTCRQGTGAASDQHAVDLPGEVALETADDLSLALAFRGAPRDVLLGATISAHPGHTDHVQRTISLPVGAAVETVAHHLAGGGFDGRDPAHRLAKDASLPNLWGCPQPPSRASRRCRCRCPPRRPTPGPLAPPAGRGAPPARRSLPRVPRSGGPPNGARTWWPRARH